MYDTKGVDVFVVDGLKFVKDSKTGYYCLCSQITTRLHRYVWTKYNGDIPKGFDIHHKDGDKNHNDLENLELLSRSDHLKLHWGNRSEEEVAKVRENLDKYARPKANEWHGTKEGREWHRKHGFDVAEKLNDRKIEKVCKCCGQVFYDNGFNKGVFCSNKCKTRYRRLTGADDVIKKCAVCGKEFKSNKYDKIQTCSPHCGSVLSYRNRKGEERSEALL